MILNIQVFFFLLDFVKFKFLNDYSRKILRAATTCSYKLIYIYIISSLISIRFFFFFWEKMFEILFIYFIFASAAVKHRGKSSTQTFTVSTSPSIEAKAP